MDGKKVEMTEEEIVKALVNTKKTLENLHEDDDDYDKLSLLKKINNSSLWLIQRLQGENADLNVKNATLEHENSELKQRVSILEADNDDYKNKIAENELVSIDWHYSQVEDLEEEKMRLGNRLSETQYSLSVCQDVNAEQKAEIERLEKKVENQKSVIKGQSKAIEEAKEENKRLYAVYVRLDDFCAEKGCLCCICENKKTCKECANCGSLKTATCTHFKVDVSRYTRAIERVGKLQKQVDELKNAYNDLLETCRNCDTTQAVKDTAEKIINELWAFLGSRQMFVVIDEETKTLIELGELWAKVNEIAKKNGVEVKE